MLLPMGTWAEAGLLTLIIKSIRLSSGTQAFLEMFGMEVMHKRVHPLWITHRQKYACCGCWQGSYRNHEGARILLRDLIQLDAIWHKPFAHQAHLPWYWCPSTEQWVVPCLRNFSGRTWGMCQKYVAIKVLIDISINVELLDLNRWLWSKYTHQNNVFFLISELSPPNHGRSWLVTSTLSYATITLPSENYKRPLSLSFESVMYFVTRMFYSTSTGA